MFQNCITYLKFSLIVLFRRISVYNEWARCCAKFMTCEIYDYWAICACVKYLRRQVFRTGIGIGLGLGVRVINFARRPYNYRNGMQFRLTPGACGHACIRSQKERHET